MLVVVGRFLRVPSTTLLDETQGHSQARRGNEYQGTIVQFSVVLRWRFLNGRSGNLGCSMYIDDGLHDVRVAISSVCT